MPAVLVEAWNLLADKIDQYSDRYDCVVSADEGGFVEYWKPLEPFELPKNVPGLWNYKSETDLYEFKKARPSTLAQILF